MGGQRQNVYWGRVLSSRFGSAFQMAKWLFVLLFTLPPLHNALSDLSGLSQREMEELDELPFFGDNLHIFSQDFQQCLKEMEWFGPKNADSKDEANFPDLQPLIAMVRTNPAKAILAILRNEPKGDTLTLNHYNVLFQCLAQQVDQTKCCVDRFQRHFPPEYANLKEFTKADILTKFIPPRGEALDEVPLAALDHSRVMENYWQTRVGGKPTDAKKLAEAIEEKRREVTVRVRITPQPSFYKHKGHRLFDCLALCDAEFPLNPWYYFPLVRSEVCSPLYTTIAYCLLPFGLIGDRALKEADYDGNYEPEGQ